MALVADHYGEVVVQPFARCMPRSLKSGCHDLSFGEGDVQPVRDDMPFRSPRLNQVSHGDCKILHVDAEPNVPNSPSQKDTVPPHSTGGSRDAVESRQLVQLGTAASCTMQHSM